MTMKLTAYIINGDPVGAVLESWSKLDLDGNEPFRCENQVSPGYEDISSIVNWDKASLLDWSRRRDEIAPLFYAAAGNYLESFASLSIEEKMIGCRYFLIPYSIRTQLITDDQDKENWATLLEYTKQSRCTCVEAMRVKAGQYIRVGMLTLVQTQQFFKDVDRYVQWFERANAPDLKLWLTNEVGSAYENDGFAQKEYFSTTLRDELITIYNGVY